MIKKEDLVKVNTIAIYGAIGTAKTSLAYKIIEQLKEDREIYFFKHPKPELIIAMGYKNLRSLEDLERLQDCVLYIDEPQLTIAIYDKKANRIIANMCSLARQLGIILIISSSDTRVFTKHNESYFDLWLIKDTDYSMVKKGSMVRKAIKDNVRFDPDGFRLEKNEFLSQSRTLRDINGKHTFTKPTGWNEKHSKPYRTEIPKETAKEVPNVTTPKNSEKEVVKEVNNDS